MNADRILAIVVTLACVGAAAASRSSADDTADDTIDAKARQLVDKLASTNKTPREREGGRDAQWPEDYDFPAQKTIYDAADELLAMGAPAIPELLKHLKDKRYSVTELSGTGATTNCSVGNECRRIFGLLIKAGSAPLWHGRGDPASVPNPTEFWQKNAHRPLWEIQLEFVEAELTTWRKRAEQPQSGMLPNIKEYVRGLEANEAKLKETHQPLPVKYPRRRMVNKKGQ
jgi:hypothetical protein